MKETLFRTIIELHEEAVAQYSRHNPQLAQLLQRAADQLERARREAMPDDEPVIILGYVNEEGPKQ